jgi:hypothetical protein
VAAAVRTFRQLPEALLLLLAFLALPSAVLGHRLDEYLQATLVVIGTEGIRLDINLTPGVAVANQVIALIDSDRDGLISTNEAAAYAEMLKRDLTVQVDQDIAGLKLTALNFPAPAELRDGSGIIQMEFSVTTGPLAAGAHKLTLLNRHLPKLSVYLFNAALPKSASIRIASQKRNDNQSVGQIEFRSGLDRAAGNSNEFAIVAAFVALPAAVFAGVANRKSLKRG